MCVTEKWDVQGRDYTSDARPSYLLYFVLRAHNHNDKQMWSERSSWSGCNRGAAAEWTQLGRRSWRGSNWGVAAEGMQSESSRWNGCNQGAASEAHAIGEQLGLATQDQWSPDITAQECCCVRIGAMPDSLWRRWDLSISLPMSAVRGEHTVYANAYRGVVLLRPLHREESYRYQTTHTGERGGSSWSKQSEWS